MKRLLQLLAIFSLLTGGLAYASCAPFTCGTPGANYNGSASPTNSVTIVCSATCDIPILEQHNTFGSPTFVITVDGVVVTTQVGTATASSAESMSEWIDLGVGAGSHIVLTTYSSSPSSGLWAVPIMGGAHLLDGVGGTLDSNNFAGPGANVVHGFSNTFTTTVAGDLIISFENWVSCAGANCPLTPGTSPNAFTNLTNCTTQVGSSLCQAFVQSSAGAIQPTATLGTNGADIITATLALQPASSPPPSSGQPLELLLGVD